MMKQTSKCVECQKSHGKDSLSTCIDDDVISSTDTWLKRIIQKYEENEDNMENMDEDYKEKIYGAI